jgi:hypothetical protein
MILFILEKEKVKEQRIYDWFPGIRGGPEHKWCIEGNSLENSNNSTPYVHHKV